VRLSTHKHLKHISKTVNNLEKRSVKRDSLTIAQINATILTILIAIFSTAAIYYLNIMKEKENIVFENAKKINELCFPISIVRPSLAFPYPKDADDSVALTYSMLDLANCVTHENSGKISVSKDIIERANSIYAIMNVVSHSYPFPEYPVEKVNAFNKKTRIQFENIEHIKKWCKDLWKVCQSLDFAIEILILRHQIGDALLNSDQHTKFFKGIKLFEESFGITDLHFVEKDLRVKLKQALEISNLVEYSLNEYDRFKKALPQELTIILFIFFGVISFILGVIYPIVTSKPRTILYVWLPGLFYVIVFIFLILMINENPAKVIYFHTKQAYLHTKQRLFKNRQASFMALGDLPGGNFRSNARGISSDGLVIVGTSISSLGNEAFRWTEATGMIGLSDLSGGIFQSLARATSADGSIIVGYGTSSLSTPNEEAMRWTETTSMIPLGDLPGDPFRGEAFSISADGSKIVGRSWIAGSDQRAFLWTETGGMVDLGMFPGESVSEAYGISSDGSIIVGWGSSVSASKEAFRWTQSTGMVGLGGLTDGADSIVRSNSFAYNVSGDGSTIVGIAGVCNKAFRWTKETGMVAISGCGGKANAASYDGSIVVGHFTSLGDTEAFIWDAVNRTRSLEKVLTDEFGIDLMGFKLKEACDISDDGSVIVGWGTNSRGCEEAWVVKFLKPSSTY